MKMFQQFIYQISSVHIVVSLICTYINMDMSVNICMTRVFYKFSSKKLCTDLKLARLKLN